MGGSRRCSGSFMRASLGHRRWEVSLSGAPLFLRCSFPVFFHSSVLLSILSSSLARCICRSSFSFSLVHSAPSMIISMCVALAGGGVLTFFRRSVFSFLWRWSQRHGSISDSVTTVLPFLFLGMSLSVGGISRSSCSSSLGQQMQ